MQPGPGSERWLSKAEAAKELKCSQRNVEKRAQQGQLAKRMSPKVHGQPRRVEYSLADINAIKSGTPNQHGEPVPRRDDAATSTDVARTTDIKTPILPTLQALMQELVRRTMDPPPPDPWVRYSTKAWLTLEAAVEYWGQPAAEIARLIRSDQILATGRGPKTWRIWRKSLDEFGDAK